MVNKFPLRVPLHEIGATVRACLAMWVTRSVASRRLVELAARIGLRRRPGSAGFTHRRRKKMHKGQHLMMAGVMALASGSWGCSDASGDGGEGSETLGSVEMHLASTGPSGITYRL